jgi:hypothetical protein
MAVSLLPIEQNESIAGGMSTAFTRRLVAAGQTILQSLHQQYRQQVFAEVRFSVRGVIQLAKRRCAPSYIGAG